MRTSEDLGLSATEIRQALHDFDSSRPVFNVGSMDSWAGQSLAARQLVVKVLEGFALFSLLLAAVGIYGIISSSASQRTFEIGIRTALGAEQGDILRLFAGKSFQLAAGLFFRHQLYGVSPFDVRTYSSMTGFLFLTSLAASFLPAWRASTIDPNKALRKWCV